MIGAWVAVVVLLVGLPLAAWWAGGRRAFWSRAESRNQRDPFQELVLRHGLSPAEVQQVTGAVSWGRTLQDDRLRAAAVDWARTSRDELDRWRTEHPRAALLRSSALFVWATVTVAGIVFATVQGRWGDVPWVAALWWVTGPVVGLLQRLALDRAIERNSGPVEAT